MKDKRPLWEILDSTKENLIRTGNCYNYHFMDINKSDWNDGYADFILNAEGNLLPQGIMDLFDIDAVMMKNGLTFLIRYKDEKQKRDRKKHVIKTLSEAPPCDFGKWLSLLTKETELIESGWTNLTDDEIALKTLDLDEIRKEIDTLRQKINNP
jgi:hypothetical protein